jgi:Zn-dependent protease with chaperone function
MTFDGFDTLARISVLTMLNNLLPGLALTLLVWLLSRTARRTSATTRFGIWWLTLGVVLILPFIRLAGLSADSVPGAERAPLSLPAAWPPAIFAAWCVFAALMLGRLAWSYGYIAWLARTAAPLPGGWQECALRLTGSRRVRILGSRETPVPVVVGLWRTAILIPLDLAGQLSQAEIEQIILHEWAHIRRRDNWTNGAYELLQALFFFHPAVWFIGRRLRLERELACDDLVVSATGQPLGYAECLAKLVECHSCPPVSLAAGASGDGRDLFRRVERLLRWEGRTTFSAFRFTAASAMLLAAGAFSLGLPAVVTVPMLGLSLERPQPAIEAARRALVAEQDIRTASILLDSARQRLAAADRILKAARHQMQFAMRTGEAVATMPVSRVVCQQPAAALPKLNKI